MKFMLMCYHEEDFRGNADPQVHEQAIGEAIALAHDLQEPGQYLQAAPLHPASTATSVRIREGKMIVTDGPFAETREVLGGYYLIDVPTIEDALAIAGRHPGARDGCVEVRPLVELPGL